MMNLILSFLRSRKPYWWMVLGAEVFSLAALILYAVNGVTNYDPHHSVQVIVGLILCMAAGVAVLILPDRGLTHSVARTLTFAQYVLSFFSLFSYIFSNMNMLGSIFYTAGGQSNIDGTTLPVSFVLLVVFIAISLVATLVAGVTMRPDAAKCVKEG